MNSSTWTEEEFARNDARWAYTLKFKQALTDGRYMTGGEMLKSIKGIRANTKCSLSEAIKILYYQAAWNIHDTQLEV